MSKKLTLGIDPGKSGAAVLLGLQDGPIYHQWKSPQDWHEFMINCKTYADLNCAEITCYLEKVWGMPGQSSVSMFNFGENFGMMQMSLIANRIPFELVTPTRWMKDYKQVLSKVKQDTKDLTAARKKTARKAALREQAAKIFVGEKITAGNADAWLIANYGHGQ